MNERIAKKWIKALRSGKYKQTSMVLHSDTGGYCCLGVLCEIYATEQKIPKEKRWVEPEQLSTLVEKDYALLFQRQRTALPLAVQVWAGMKTSCGKYNNNLGELAEDNDKGKRFKTIANIIEKNWKDL